METLQMQEEVASRRRLPIGAEVLADGGTHFRVWAPRVQRVEVCLLDDQNQPAAWDTLEPEDGGYFSGVSALAAAGTRYRFRLDQRDPLYADPASRFQPEGPHGPSQVVDPGAFEWTDSRWAGAELAGAVLYELHLGTFTGEGKWPAAEQRLPELVDLGVTVLQIMPLADFPGRFGWGYDGVNFFAPTRLYGTPDDVRRFIDRAHGLGLGVILDVVYNHFGPDGNFLDRFSNDYVHKTRRTEWGPAVNFDGDNCGPVREYFLANAGYWIDEFHFDGLRLDATQDICDASPEHILTALARQVRQAAAGRSTLIVAENEPQQAKLVRPVEQDGYGLDAIWNDDFHHSAMVVLSGRNEAYYSDHQGRPQEFVSAAKRGFLYQGQWYSWQNQPRGTPASDLEPARFVHFIQNHDQIANTALGQRAHTWTSPGRYKAMTALLLLAPQTPMLFQGQEFAASSPFFYFADHTPELAALVEKGRKEFMRQFPSLARPEVQSQLPSPGDPQTFVRSKLNWLERQSHAATCALHRDLLKLRREDPVFRQQRRGGVDGAVLSGGAFVLRFFGPGGDDRLLLVNFDPDLHLTPMPEPLLAPPEDKQWQMLWSSEELCYGGSGTPPLAADGHWVVPGQAAVVLAPDAMRHGESEADGKE
jgi:maltooligosyltrehalose trehalohydrolase